MPVTLNAPGYERLESVLEAAHKQASEGKGKERHANDLPFDKQPMQVIAASHGVGFITGQAAKKLEEAVGMLDRGERDAAIKELLGAVVYAAGAVIYVEDRKQAGAPEGEAEGEWVPWCGGALPFPLIPLDAVVDVRLRSGSIFHRGLSGSFSWWRASDSQALDDIVAYRLSRTKP